MPGLQSWRRTTQLALAQGPKPYRRGRRTLIRTNSACGTREFLTWRAKRGRWLSYSVGMTITDEIHQAVLKVPLAAWTPAVDRTERSATGPGSPNSPAACSTADRRACG